MQLLILYQKVAFVTKDLFQGLAMERLEKRMECLSGAAHRFQHDEIYHYG